MQGSKIISPIFRTPLLSHVLRVLHKLEYIFCSLICLLSNGYQSDHFLTAKSKEIVKETVCIVYNT